MQIDIERLENQAILLSDIWVCLIGETAKAKVNQMLIEKQEEIKKVVLA